MALLRLILLLLLTIALIRVLLPILLPLGALLLIAYVAHRYDRKT